MDAELRLLLRLLIAELGADTSILPWIEGLIAGGADPVIRATFPDSIIGWARTFRPDLLAQVQRLIRAILRTLPEGSVATAEATAAAEAAAEEAAELAARDLARRLAIRAGLGSVGGTTAGAIALGLAPALALFFGGLLLPASRLGDLGFDNPLTRGQRRRAAAAMIRDLLIAHAGQRDQYVNAPSHAGLRGLHNDAERLASAIRAFLAYWGTDTAEGKEMARALAQISDWLTEYYYGIVSSRRPPVPAVPAPGMPVPVAPVPPPPAGAPLPHPSTEAKPPSSDFMHGEFIREQIKYWRRRMRELKRKLRELGSGVPETRKLIDAAIADAEAELEKLRADAKATGQATAEEWDEPLDPPAGPPGPDWPLGHDWLNPSHLYINPETGREAFMSPPPPAGWSEATGDDGKPRFRWGWVLRANPVTLEPEWVPGWTEQ